MVGAGLAGLSAAYELTRAGHDVAILEARTRPGARVLTLRAPFSDGLYDEAGAAYIPDSHDWTMKYIKLRFASRSNCALEVSFRLLRPRKSNRGQAGRKHQVAFRSHPRRKKSRVGWNEREICRVCSEK